MFSSLSSQYVFFVFLSAEDFYAVPDGNIPSEHDDFRLRISFHADDGVFSDGDVFINDRIGYGRSRADDAVCQHDRVLDHRAPFPR